MSLRTTVRGGWVCILCWSCSERLIRAEPRFAGLKAEPRAKSANDAVRIGYQRFPLEVYDQTCVRVQKGTIDATGH